MATDEIFSVDNITEKLNRMQETIKFGCIFFIPSTHGETAYGLTGIMEIKTRDLGKGQRTLEKSVLISDRVLTARTTRFRQVHSQFQAQARSMTART